MAKKPHKGSLKNWYKFGLGIDKGLGYVIIGEFVDHPEFAGKEGHTSYVVKHEGNEVETNNSRYTLIGEEYHGV